ncbi:MAG: hypothetical protein PHQ40_19545 [Anaerolineaceae bacterium]|nr:hypothetical protein [Anaerolineaceae bacterium]
MHETVSSLVLEGAGSARPFRGARYLPAGGAEEVLEEQIDLLLEDSAPSEIASGMSRLERFLGLARTSFRNQCGRPVYLTVVGAEGEEAWRSLVQDGWVETLGGGRSRGSLGVRLHLRRENAWEAPETALPLSNRGGTRVTAPLPVSNHTDWHSGHDNYVEIAGSDVTGDLPAAMRLELTNLGGSATTYLFIGLDQHPSGSEFFSPWLEAEDALMVVGVDDAACSAGKKVNLAWQGSEETELCAWSLREPQPARAGGRFFKVIARATDGGIHEADVWLRTCLRVNGSPVWDGAWTLAPIDQELVELNLLPLPPYLAGLDSLAGISLALQARCSASGSHGFALDYLQITPLDGWRRLVSTGRGVPDDFILYEDGLRSLVYTGPEGRLFETDFVAYGDALRLQPGITQRLVVLQAAGNGQALAERAMAVQAFTRARRRSL